MIRLTRQIQNAIKVKYCYFSGRECVISNAFGIIVISIHLYLILGDENLVSGSKDKEAAQKSSFHSEPRTEIDEVSRKILEMTNPGLLDFTMPRRTLGDGNCLFRATSIAVYKDETKHAKLRQLVFQEMKENSVWYNKDDPNFCSPFANDHDIMLENFSFYIENTPKLNEWCDINHILALSAVLKQPIESYYPNIQSIVSPYSRVVKGRGVQEPENPDTKIKIMWTSTEFPEQIADFRPNHFVPLIPLQADVEKEKQGK